MVPAQLSGFFAASTAAAAALIGLLFVAISVAPQRVFGTAAAPHAIATSAFIALADALFISFGALISATTCAWIALAMGVVGLVGTLAQAYTLLYLELNPRLVAVRSLLVVAALLVYVVQCWYAGQILLQPNATWPAYGLANVLLAVFALGILRAYGLLGAHVTGLRAWLGPRRYTPNVTPEPEAQFAQALDSKDTGDHTP